MCVGVGEREREKERKGQGQRAERGRKEGSEDTLKNT